MLFRSRSASCLPEVHGTVQLRTGRPCRAHRATDCFIHVPKCTHGESGFTVLRPHGLPSAPRTPKPALFMESRLTFNLFTLASEGEFWSPSSVLSP